MRKILAVAAILLASVAAAHAQSTCPPFTYGAVLTAGQWQACFDAKQNALGYVPVNRAGDVMQGPLGTFASALSSSGFNVPPGVAPTAPVNGDMWSTSAGFFVRVNGVTVGPLTGGASASFAATSPITVSFPAGVVTYAFDLSVANTFTAQQTDAGLTTTSPGWYAQITGDAFARVRVGLNATDIPSIAFGPGSGARDAFIERVGPGVMRLGAPDAASAVAQTLSVQNVVAGTSNTAGSSLTIAGSRGTGTGVGGSIIFQVAPAGTTGSTQNALATALTIDSTKLATFAAGLQATAAALGGASIGGNALAVTGTSLFNSAVAVAATLTVTSTSASAVAVGPNGATNPTLVVDASTASAATGLKVKSAAAAGGLALSVVTSGTNENLSIDAAGAGTITLGGTSTGAIVNTRATTLSAALTYGGVTLTNAVTGTGRMVLDSASTIASLTVTGAFTATGLVTNADLVSPTITVNGTSCTLGSSCSPTATASSITVAVTTISGSADTRILRSNAGVLGDYTISGSGTVVAMATAPSFTTPTLGAALFTSLAGPVVGPQSNSTTAVKITKADLSTAVMTFDTTNARVGINKTPGAFDLDVNGAVNGGSTINATTGYQVAGAATTAHYLRGNGTNYVDSAILAGDLPLATNAAIGGMRGDTTTISCTAGVCTAVGAAATSVAVGTTTISSGTTLNVLYDNAGTLANQPIASFLSAGAGISITGTTTATIASTVKVVTQGPFSTNGTYTPTTGMITVQVYTTGGGGGGGSVTGSASQHNVSNGGGGGSTSLCTLTAATVGASKAYTVGGGGAGGTSGGAGAAGTDSTFNTTTCVGKGGSGGTGGSNGTTGGAGGVAGTGDVKWLGGGGFGGIILASNATGTISGGSGGSSYWTGETVASNCAGITQVGPAGGDGGGGGGGSCSSGSASTSAGGAGGTGRVFFVELVAP